MCSLAAGKVLVAVEGGYDLRSLSRSVCAVMRVLLGERAPPLAAAEPHMAAKRSTQQNNSIESPRFSIDTSTDHKENQPEA